MRTAAWRDWTGDDWKTQLDIALLPGQSITARINSDIALDGANPAAWAWGDASRATAVPRWGIESADDRDVIRFDIAEAGEYRISVVEGPDTVGLWIIFAGQHGTSHLSWKSPVSSHQGTFQPGSYYAGAGTSYESVGNTGDYTLAVTAVEGQG